MKLADLTGKQFGRLTVLSFSHTARKPCGHTYPVWNCQCSCGVLRAVCGGDLRSGHTVSCGCYRREETSRLKRLDLTGNIYGRLTVLGIHSVRRSLLWKCRCECGGEAIVLGYHLTSGHTISCGCYTIDNPPTLTHGESRCIDGGRATPEYAAWIHMNGRCYNPNPKVNRYWGARGVQVCDRWRYSYESFLADVGRRPSQAYSLDRYPDPNGNYEPGNVRWATVIEQRHNRRDYVTAHC